MRMPGVLSFQLDDTHGQHKRLRSGWRVRRGFKAAQRYTAIAGGLAAVAAVQIAALQLDNPLLVTGRDFLVPAVLLVTVGIALPWAAIEVLWRHVLRRNLDAWGGRIPR
jgi:hypothetical protein